MNEATGISDPDLQRTRELVIYALRTPSLFLRAPREQPKDLDSLVAQLEELVETEMGAYAGQRVIGIANPKGNIRRLLVIWDQTASSLQNRIETFLKQVPQFLNISELRPHYSIPIPRDEKDD